MDYPHGKTTLGKAYIKISLTHLEYYLDYSCADHSIACQYSEVVLIVNMDQAVCNDLYQPRQPTKTMAALSQ